jgi:hypothetical protein
LGKAYLGKAPGDILFKGMDLIILQLKISLDVEINPVGVKQFNLYGIVWKFPRTLSPKCHILKCTVSKCHHAVLGRQAFLAINNKKNYHHHIRWVISSLNNS